LVVENTVTPDAPSFRIGNEPVESSTVWSSVQEEEEFRILPTAITERFCMHADGELEPVISGSTGVVAQVVTHRAQVAAIELVGGRVAEQILHPNDAPLVAEHDQIEARAFAAVACAAPQSASALLAYARPKLRLG
jgi:hypothetical protein